MPALIYVCLSDALSGLVSGITNRERRHASYLEQKHFLLQLVIEGGRIPAPKLEQVQVIHPHNREFLPMSPWSHPPASAERALF